jgi:hypothetical protein
MDAGSLADEQQISGTKKFPDGEIATSKDKSLHPFIAKMRLFR